MSAENPQYTYYVYNPLTDEFIDTLEVTDVSFTNGINGEGTFSAQLNISDPIYVNKYRDWDSATEPYTRRALYVDRDGVLVWGGFIIGRTYDSSSQTLSIEGVTFDYFADRRFLGPPNSFGPKDINEIARDVWRLLGDQPYELLWQYDTNLCGTVGSYAPELWNVMVREYLKGLEERDSQGIEWYVDVYWDNTTIPRTPMRKFAVNCPTLPMTDMSLVASINSTGGNILDYTWDESGDGVSVDLYALGSGSESGQARGFFQDHSLFSEDYPFTTVVINANDIIETDELNQAAARQYKINKARRVVPKLTVKPDASFPLGDLKPGFVVLVEITDPRFPLTGTNQVGYREIFRVVKYSVTPGDVGEEKVSLELEGIYDD